MSSNSSWAFDAAAAFALIPVTFARVLALRLRFATFRIAFPEALNVIIAPVPLPALILLSLPMMVRRLALARSAISDPATVVKSGLEG